MEKEGSGMVNVAAATKSKQTVTCVWGVAPKRRGGEAEPRTADPARTPPRTNKVRNQWGRGQRVNRRRRKAEEAAADQTKRQRKTSGYGGRRRRALRNDRGQQMWNKWRRGMYRNDDGTARAPAALHQQQTRGWKNRGKGREAGGRRRGGRVRVWRGRDRRTDRRG